MNTDSPSVPEASLQWRCRRYIRRAWQEAWICELHAGSRRTGPKEHFKSKPSNTSSGYALIVKVVRFQLRHVPLERISVSRFDAPLRPKLKNLACNRAGEVNQYATPWVKRWR